MNLDFKLFITYLKTPIAHTFVHVADFKATGNGDTEA
jgi:hypothetical protein